jgi:hypothetical protein
MLLNLLGISVECRQECRQFQVVGTVYTYEFKGVNPYSADSDNNFLQISILLFKMT